MQKENGFRNIQKLEEFSYNDFRSLTRYTIVFGIFVDRREMKNKHKIVNNLKKTADERITKVEKRWKTLI